MTLLYLHEYFRIHARRDALIRFISFFALFLYGLLNWLENDVENTKTVYLFFPMVTLHSLMHVMLVISRQFDLVRLVTRIFDFPTNFYNLATNLNSVEKVKKNFI